MRVRSRVPDDLYYLSSDSPQRTQLAHGTDRPYSTVLYSQGPAPLELKVKRSSHHGSRVEPLTGSGVVEQHLGRRELRAVLLLERLHLVSDGLRAGRVDVHEGAAQEGGEADAEDRPDVAVTRRGDDVVHQAMHRLRDEAQQVAVDQLLSSQLGGILGGLRAILGEDLEGPGVDGLNLLLATVVEEALARLAPQVALFDKLVQHRQVTP